MAKRVIVVEYEEHSIFDRVLAAVQEQLGHHDNPMQAIIDATTLYAIQKGLLPTSR